MEDYDSRKFPPETFWFPCMYLFICPIFSNLRQFLTRKLAVFHTCITVQVTCDGVKFKILNVSFFYMHKFYNKVASFYIYLAINNTLYILVFKCTKEVYLQDKLTCAYIHKSVVYLHTYVCMRPHMHIIALII